MKSILLLAVLASVALNAQVTVVSPRLTDSTAAVVYIGVDNPIEVKGMDKPEYYLVTISGGGSSITKVSPDRYIIKAFFQDSLTLSILRLDKVMLRKKFAVKLIPEGQLLLAGSADNNVSKETILANPKLEYVFPGCLYKLGVEVISFTMTIDKGPEIIEVRTNSATLSEKQLQLIKEAAPGVMFTIDDIYARGPDGRTRKVPSLVRYLR